MGLVNLDIWGTIARHLQRLYFETCSPAHFNLQQVQHSQAMVKSFLFPRRAHSILDDIKCSITRFSFFCFHPLGKCQQPRVNWLTMDEEPGPKQPHTALQRAAGMHRGDEGFIGHPWVPTAMSWDVGLGRSRPCIQNLGQCKWKDGIF